MENLLLIFAKNPVPGKAKTRLSKDLGVEKAMEIYKGLLSYTSSIAQACNAEKELHYADFINEDDMWPNDQFTKLLQEGSDLGERMQNAFQQAFKKGFKRVLIIGTDCKDLTTDDLNLAFEKLENNDAVIGPANDGGYYLLGLSQMNQAVFQNKEWSTSSVFPNTIKTFQEEGFSFEVLEELVDVDHASDLEQKRA